MRFQKIIEQVYYRPWYITPAAHASIHRIVSARLLHTKADDGCEIDFSAFVNQRQEMAMDADGIATIHILGPLGKGLSPMEKSCGCTGFEDVRADYAAAIAGGAKGLLLRFDSPGGTVMGTPELAALIASRPLPTVAYTEDVMASAAYYLAAGANQIIASPSSALGSIGVYIPWMDYIDQLKAEGLNPNPVVNAGGDLKALGFGGVLTEAQRAYLQEMVNTDFAKFRDHVRVFRDVPDSAMRGQVLDGHAAVEANLADALGELSDAKAALLAMISQ